MRAMSFSSAGQVVVQDGRIGLQQDRLLLHVERLVVAAELVQHGGAVALGHEGVRGELHRQLVVGEGGLQALELQVGEAQVVVGLGQRAIVELALAVQCNGLAHLALELAQLVVLCPVHGGGPYWLTAAAPSVPSSGPLEAALCNLYDRRGVGR